MSRAQQSRSLHWRGLGSRDVPQQIVLRGLLLGLTLWIFVLRNFENELAPHCEREIPVAAHTNCYITKPVDLDQFLKVVKTIDNFWLTIVKLPRPAS